MKPLGALALTFSLLALSGSTKGQSVVCKTPNIIFGTGANFEGSSGIPGCYLTRRLIKVSSSAFPLFRTL